jgi:hypothetical protein
MWRDDAYFLDIVPLTPTLSRLEREKIWSSAFSGVGGEETGRRPSLRRGHRG